MGLFNRKKKEEPKDKLDFDIPKLPHKCIMKDLPWYMEVEYNGSEKWAEYRIIEPYICINGCGLRKNVVLEEERWLNIDSATRDEYYEKVRKQYKKYLKPRAVVEDMINNILLVKDPEYLDTVELMRGTPHRRCGTSAEMKRIDEKENNIGELIVPKENNK